MRDGSLTACDHFSVCPFVTFLRSHGVISSCSSNVSWPKNNSGEITVSSLLPTAGVKPDCGVWHSLTETNFIDSTLKRDNEIPKGNWTSYSQVNKLTSVITTLEHQRCFK